ncbi:MAG: polya polymerase [Firmicutes bacterium HGW-Firmicutes-7]|nr:MAG: polya polymerase [Firmicutes bacterium HGW-Firmicutes-7]
MKIKNITDIERFFEVIDRCKGKVELITSDGDCLNLKSKLSQYFSLAQIFSDGTIPEIEIIASDADDMKQLIQYLIQG